MHQSQLHSIDELKKRLLDVWHGMDQIVIDDVIDGWRKRLRARIRAKGGHFEQMTIAVSAELYDKRYFVSSNMTFVICRKFELYISTGSAATYSGCGGTYYMDFVCSLLLFPAVKDFWKSVRF